MPVARYFISFALLLAVIYAAFLFGGKGLTPKLGLDLQGGTTVTLRALTSKGNAPSAQDLNVARQIIQNRVNGLGVTSAEVTTEGDRNIVISIPGAGSEEAKQLGQTALLELRPVVQAVGKSAPGQSAANPKGTTATDKVVTVNQGAATPEEAATIATTLDCSATNLAPPPPAKQYMAACGADGTTYVLGPVIIKGTSIKDASSSFDTQGGQGWQVSLDFNNAGSAIWSKYTAENIGKNVAFVLDQKILSAPTINSAIPGTTSITGSFTKKSAGDLANSLKFGALPLNFTQSEAQTISATLGLASLEAGLIAGAIGLALVILYCLLYYRLLGIVTILSLALSAAVIYPILVLLGRGIGLTLSLSGIAGFIVAIGITADSFVVYFERIKDEVMDGRSTKSAVPRAWVRARRTILSADAVSFLAAAILYFLTVGEVKGFAFTLGLSTVLDLIVVFLFTHPLVSWLSRFRWFASPTFSGLGRNVRHSRTHEAESRAKKAAKAKRAASKNAVGKNDVEPPDEDPDDDSVTPTLSDGKSDTTVGASAKERAAARRAALSAKES
ncbi:preprotein translocase subunit SecD [Antricoccus suffuscus]|uniref:Protein translocase subunit SecD n=2 Tax=Antricoccus suffuscus TaxID=1629062 RepID=A0A2T0ZW93_9ACTN|nr:preprotein translocase subunit SecD [Antricoccus suffuscus]